MELNETNKRIDRSDLELNEMEGRTASTELNGLEVRAAATELNELEERTGPTELNEWEARARSTELNARKEGTGRKGGADYHGEGPNNK